jgi:hypothetical protein
MTTREIYEAQAERLDGILDTISLHGYSLADSIAHMKSLRDSLRALAASAPEQEPVAHVAEVHMSRYTVEWTNGPLPQGAPLYEHPSADAQSREAGGGSTVKAAGTSAARVPDVADLAAWLHAVSNQFANDFADKMLQSADALERLQAELAHAAAVAKDRFEVIGKMEARIAELEANLGKSIECNGHLMDTQNKQAARIAELEADWRVMRGLYEQRTEQVSAFEADHAKARELLRECEAFCGEPKHLSFGLEVRIAQFLSTKPGETK